MEGLETLIDILPLLLPVLLIDLGVRIYAIVDLVNPDRVVTINNNKIVWILIVALVNFGGFIYLLFGRKT